ncbi:MAG: catalase [Clostridia bacterium]|nr:catalase [Clostridia bacterium]
MSKFFSHISLVTRHKWAVFKNCVRCGLIWRGIVHDLSKFSPEEFFESVKYYQGNRSPIGAARRATGMSLAWLHHKGRNKHHIEYWTDGECAVQPLMPYKYLVECVCDKLAATKTYAGKNYNKELPLEHWRRYGCKVLGNPKTMELLDVIFCDVSRHGEDYVLSKKYLKEKYREICLSTNDAEKTV